MATRMRAAIFERAGRPLTIGDLDVPKPGPGELLIRVHRCGICGSDLHMTDSKSCFNPPAGAIIGHEYCGEVVDVGEGIGDGWREGRRVVAFPYVGCGCCAQCLAGEATWCARARGLGTGGGIGGFAEYSVIGAAETLALPDLLSWDEGAFVEPIAVGVHAVRIAQMQPGAHVLVVGAGPVGLATAACARALGAGSVIVTARSERQTDRARAMGATDLLVNDERLAERFAVIAGGPPETVFECVGLPGMLARCIELAAPRATVVMAGACMQEESLLPIAATLKELRIQYAICYSRRDFETALGLISSGAITPMAMLSEAVGLDAFPAAFESLRERGDKCKILLSSGV